MVAKAGLYANPGTSVHDALAKPGAQPIRHQQEQCCTLLVFASLNTMG